MKTPLYYEDLEIGDQDLSVGRTVTETDVVSFAGVSGDYNTIHTDREYARSTVFGERVAHGLLVQAIASGLFTRTAINLRLMPSLVAMTEIRSWKFLKPVFIGDTLRVRVSLIEKIDPRPEKKNARIVLLREVINQKDEIVQTGETVLLVKKRTSDTEESS